MQGNELVGRRFGRWEAIEKAPSKGQGAHWLCKCDCGHTAVVRARQLQAGKSKSCGCYQREVAASGQRTHGKSSLKKDGYRAKPRIYRTWTNMKSRCNNPKSSRYESYGGRGIRVCAEWESNYMTFHNWAVENGYQDDLQIDRIDNDGNYTPLNCRWVTLEENNRNSGRTKRITCGGETHTIPEWAKIKGISERNIRQRLYRGKSPEEALEK